MGQTYLWIRIKRGAFIYLGLSTCAEVASNRGKPRKIKNTMSKYIKKREFEKCRLPPLVIPKNA